LPLERCTSWKPSLPEFAPAADGLSGCSSAQLWVLVRAAGVAFTPVSVSAASRGNRTSTHSDETERSLLVSQLASAAALAPSPKPEFGGKPVEGLGVASWPLVRTDVGMAFSSVRPAFAMVGSLPMGYSVVSTMDSAMVSSLDSSSGSSYAIDAGE